MNFLLLFLLNNVYYKLLNPTNLGCENKRNIFRKLRNNFTDFRNGVLLCMKYLEIEKFIGLMI